jgi:lysophospholipase L1-like esterase
MYNEVNRRKFIKQFGALSSGLILGSCGLTKRNKTLICFVGDSLTVGIGTTGTTEYPFEVGIKTYPLQTLSLLKKVDYRIFGYSGQTASKYNSEHKNNDLKEVKTGYKYKIAAIFFGNDEVTQFDVNETYNNITSIHKSFKENGFKTVTVPVLNRKDKFVTQPKYNYNRLALNSLLIANWRDFSDAFANIPEQPNIYSTNAPDNPVYFNPKDVDGLSKVHLTDKGAQLVALEVSRAIKSILNKA